VKVRECVKGVDQIRVFLKCFGLLELLLRAKSFAPMSCFVSFIACLQYQNKSGCCGGPAFTQPIRAILKVFKEL